MKPKQKRKRWFKRHQKRMKRQMFNKAWRDHFVRVGILK